MTKYAVHVPGAQGVKSRYYIYGANVEDAVRANLDNVICINYDNVMRAGERKLMSVEYRPGILGGYGGHVAIFEFEQGVPTNGRRTGEAWLYTNADGTPRSY